MANVLCISSQTVWGPVGNSAAVPALQSQGHGVLQVPTVLLSNHPGHGKPIGQSTPAQLLGEMLAKLVVLQASQSCTAVMTGYFADAEQVAVVAQHVAKMKLNNPGLMILVDPVIGDHGALYVPEATAIAIRDQLLPLATIATPNLFELAWLTNDMNAQDSPEVAALNFHIPEVIVTSVPRVPDQLATLLVQKNAVVEHKTKHLKQVPHGTGDYLAGLYLAFRLTTSAEDAFAAACKKLDSAIAKSAGTAVLHVV